MILNEMTKKFLSPDHIRTKGTFYTLSDEREDISYLNIFSIARSLRKLMAKKFGLGKFEEPEIKAISGFKIVCFLWLNFWLISFY